MREGGIGTKAASQETCRSGFATTRCRNPHIHRTGRPEKELGCLTCFAVAAGTVAWSWLACWPCLSLMPGLRRRNTRSRSPIGKRTFGVERAPQRIVSIGQGMTEIMLSLGIADRIVGTGIWLTPLPEALAEAGSALPRLADNCPGFGAVLNTRPDFVAAPWINDIAPQQARVGTFAQFADFGITTYVSPAECAKNDFSAASGDGTRSQAWRMELLNQQSAELAAIFDVLAAGNALIAENAARVEAASAHAQALQAQDITVLYWFSSPQIDGAAYVTAKRAFLESDPVASQLSAARNSRLIEMSAHAMNPILRAVDGVDALVGGLRDLGLAR